MIGLYSVSEQILRIWTLFRVIPFFGSTRKITVFFSGSHCQVCRVIDMAFPGLKSGMTHLLSH